MKTGPQIKDELFTFQNTLNNVTTDLLSHQVMIGKLDDLMHRLYLHPEHKQIKEDIAFIKAHVYDISPDAVLFRYSNIKHNLDKLVKVFSAHTSSPKVIHIRTVEEVHNEYNKLSDQPNNSTEETLKLRTLHDLLELHEEYYEIKEKLSFFGDIVTDVDRFKYKWFSNRLNELEEFLNTNKD